MQEQSILLCSSATPHRSICLFRYRSTMVDCNRSSNRICTDRIFSTLRGYGSNDVSNSRVPHVLTLAGSDSGAGAGIQADLKACAARGVYCSTVITAITAQNSFGVQGINVVAEKFVAEQLRSVFSDMPVDVIKTGMIPTVGIVNILCQFMKDFSIQAPLVVDPVMVSTSGDLLADSSVLDEIRRKLLPLAKLVTPNLKEASALIGGGAMVHSISDMRSAAKAIHHMGLCNVLVKGGDLPSSFDAVDIFYDGKDFYELQSPRIKTNNTHGTGCTLASAIAAEIAKGTPVLPAVKIAKRFVEGALNYSKDLSIGNGSQGPFDHFLQLKNSKRILSFDPGMLLLYAVTDSTINRRRGRSIEDAIRAVIEGGATIVQLREKDGEGTLEFVRAARSCLEICRSRGVPLIINDRVDVAMASGADGVHLGQSDMPAAVARSLLGPERIIGVSCKSAEMARQAWIDSADYIGCGGVYPTSTKADNPTIGIDGLKAICFNSKLPVVAIGGINTTNVYDVMSLCIPALKGVALVSALFDAECIVKKAQCFRTILEEALPPNPVQAVEDE